MVKHTITDPDISRTLNALHGKAGKELPKILRGLSKGIFRALQPEDMKDAFIAISQDQGRFLYDFLVQHRCRHIVEFGTSFGISTIYLAAAARATGGRVITTELLPEKCRVARQHFALAGLAETIDLREGDACETLKAATGPIDFLLLDGWNNLYLPVLQLLEPRLQPGAFIYTDNANFRSAQPFLEHLRSRPGHYESVRLPGHKGGAELTRFLG